MSTKEDKEIRSQLLHIFIGDFNPSDEQYIDNKAKFLIDDVLPFIKSYAIQKALEELEGIKKETEYRMLNDLQVVGGIRTINGLSGFTNKVVDDRIAAIKQENI